MSTAKTIVLGYPCHVCQKASFYLKERPFVDERIYSAGAFCHDTKKQPKNNSHIICQWCSSFMAEPLLPRHVTIYDYETGEHCA